MKTNNELELKVGGKYISGNGLEIEIIAITNENVFNRVGDGRERLNSIEHARNFWKPAPTEREKIELWACIDGSGCVVYLDENNKYPMFSHKEMRYNGVIIGRIPNIPSIFIYADDFTVVGE